MIMVAGAAALQGQGLGVSSSTTSATTSSTNSFAGMSALKSAQTAASTSTSIASSAGTNMISMGGLTFPGVGNAIPIGDQLNYFTSLGSNFSGMTGLVSDQANSIMGVDLGQFAQHLGSAEGFVASQNPYITAIGNYATQAVVDYTKDAIITGAMSIIGPALPSWADDLLAVGSIINFGDLKSFGNPIYLAQNMQNTTGGLSVLNDALRTVGLDPSAVSNVLRTTDIDTLSNMTVAEALGDGGLTFYSQNTLNTPVLGGLELAGASQGTATGFAGLADIGSGISDTFSSIGTGISNTVSGVSNSVTDFFTNVSAPDLPSLTNIDLTGSPAPLNTPVLGGLELAGASTGVRNSGTLGLVAPDTGFMKAIYDAMGYVTDASLDTVQSIFGSSIKGIESMQDLLDPSKLFPNSYDQLTSLPPGMTAADFSFKQAQGLLQRPTVGPDQPLTVRIYST